MTSSTGFAVGQKVSFIAVRQAGEEIKFSSLNGTVQELDGDVAIVKTRNGRRHTAKVADLRADGERNALTEAVLAVLGGETA